MPSIVTAAETERVVRRTLKAEGYRLSRLRENGETGVDILAARGAQRLHIEVIGFKSSGPARSRDFMQAFFRAISRIPDGATRCIIALPSRWGNGLPRRAEQYGCAWERIAQAFPELEIWLVDCKTCRCSQSRWGDWLHHSDRAL